MFVVILLWLYIFILLYLYGLAAIHGLRQILKLDKNDVINFSLVLLVGIVTIAVVAMLSQLFIPLGAVFMAALSAGALVIFLQKRFLPPVYFPRYRPLTWGILAVVFFTVLVNATHIPSNPDTGLYHAQTIRWYEMYRIVPGLGNLQERYAFNSAWLVLNAALSFAFLGLRSFRLANGIVFLIALLFFADGLDNLERKRLSMAGVAKVLFLPLAVLFLISDVSSAGNDMPVSLITWMIFVLWIETIEAPVASELKKGVIFLLSVFVLTIKLSSLLLLCFPILIAIEYLVKGKAGVRRVFILGMLSVLILGCWAIRSVILSGYVVFPLSKIDLFSLDWKVPKEQLQPVIQGVVDVARLGIKTRESSADMTFWQWFSLWFERETLNRISIYVLVLISPSLLLIGQYKSAFMALRKYLPAYLIAMAGSIFWFLSAPDVRFGYGFLIGVCVLSLAPLIKRLMEVISVKMNLLPRLILLALLMFQAYTLWYSLEPSTLTQRLLFPADYRTSKVDACEISNAMVYCRREGAQCQYESFPCIPSPRPQVELRGSTFQQGFRTTP